VKPAEVLGFAAQKEYYRKTSRPNQMWASDGAYLKVPGWGYYYLVTVLDDYSRFILAWRLQLDMTAGSLIEVVQDAVEKTGMTEVPLSDRTALLPAGLAHSGARQVFAFDYDDDGDLDLLVVGLDGQVHLLRNDGGNANEFVNVRLVALRDGSGKNNYFGIGSRLELRAKDLYQMRVVDQPVVHFGLGNRLKADVLRVVWTNGVPQTYYYRGGEAGGADRNVLEQQVLKGSCTFLYTWDGEAYRFLTDVTWASALGMPLGIMAGEKTVYGPPQAAREYFRIPGNRLKPVAGRYRMQLTEELWEVAYVDQLALLAIDHPESVNVFVDERFVPPSVATSELAIHQVRNEQLPLSATDERGRDLLPLLRAKDDAYVGGFVPGPYQGVTETHDLVLDLGPLTNARDITLFLEGWLFPTDASINAANDCCRGSVAAVRCARSVSSATCSTVNGRPPVCSKARTTSSGLIAAGPPNSRIAFRAAG